jgi:STAS domain
MELDLGTHEFSRLVLDVRGTNRLDSFGVRLLVRYAVRLRKRGGDLWLAGPPVNSGTCKPEILSRVFEAYPTLCRKAGFAPR